MMELLKPYPEKRDALVEQLVVECPELEEQAKEATQLILSGFDFVSEREIERLVLSILFDILTAIVHTIKDAISETKNENRVYFVSHFNGGFWHLYFAVGFSGTGEGFEEYGIDLQARKMLENLAQPLRTFIDVFQLEVDTFDLESQADRELFEETTKTMTRIFN